MTTGAIFVYFVLVSLALESRPFAIAKDPPCVEWDSSFITAGDLAVHVPAYRGMKPGLRFGPAPDPGLRRVISANELNRFLHRPELRGNDTLAERGLCIVRRSRTLPHDEVLLAMQREFPGRAVQIQVLEVSKSRVGVVGGVRFSIHELPLAGNPALAVTWNGWFVEPDGRKRPVWARVRLCERVAMMVAKKDIAAGEVLEDEHLAAVDQDRYPGPTRVGSAREVPTAVQGKAAKRPILAGSPVRPEMLEPVPSIRKGDVVTLEVLSSHTRLAVEGKAESTAMRGSKVAVSTPFSKRVVLAVAQEKGRATLITGGVGK
jgi:flagella basal body P-ring formation protein FlgA